jgi:hypothetical protein
MRVGLFTRIAIISGSKEYTASQFGGIGLATAVVAERHDTVEGETVEIEVAARDFAPVRPEE